MEKAYSLMRIHSPSPRKLPVSRCADYFFNYFTLGLDVLFNCTRHRAKKFVLYTLTCLATITSTSIIAVASSSHSPLRASPIEVSADWQGWVHTSANGSLHADSPSETLNILPSTKWIELQDYLNHPADKPVVLNRSSSTNSVNPFGSTYCYGYQNVIFEVMRNSHIASVTIYNSQLRH